METDPNQNLKSAARSLLRNTDYQGPDALWLEFWESVKPPDCSREQKSEMRRSFYAGMWGLLTEVLRISEDEVPEDQGVARLGQFRRECERFYRDLKAGRA